MARYLRERYKGGLAPQHIWLGVSIEDTKNAVRLNHLKAARASISKTRAQIVPLNRL